MDHTAAQRLGDLPTAELRRHGHVAVDWVADYLDRLDMLPVLAQVAPGALRAALPASPPAVGEDMEAVLADIDRLIVPATTHWNHPRFFAYFAITGSGPGILGELLTAAFNVNGMLWRTSPAATELEQVTLDWLRQMLGLPATFRGAINDTASMSTLHALAAARERRFPAVREEGPDGYGGARPRVYASEQAHSSVDKAAIALGLGRSAVRRVATDRSFRMDVTSLVRALDEDAGRWTPLAVVATVGTTSTTSVDPVAQIAQVCHERGVWLHVDGAYGGIAAVVPELRWVLEGAEHADSVVVNPHKWLFTPIDCSAFFVRDPVTLKRAFALVPEYLRSTEQDVENYMDWGVQLGRRFRALKLWMVLRAFGVDGVVRRLREHIRLAQLVADWADRHPEFERLAPAPLSTVCLRARFHGVTVAEADRRNAALLEAVNATGHAYLSHTELYGRYVLRLAVGNLRTTEADVRSTLALLEREAERLR
ncbi:MAG TPA: pyridoxal-dependent decarboxylase [Nitriliruptorales bacterium]|nr:pyridoxal-dependent decarboxylase [Nitriliruptorales bacterium]